ncbi:MAG: CHAT domain-containing protein [Okeania sp. SIO2C9]|uniref:pentapeptide repeat-containing protein n=1 Tax=Okeania sp. SIO2C9 TaxID=2607791 RepID=UPI0013C059B4|nr:pentapeptide repeat-containing protein [Okeania sp. SIO2C9]NEQ77750.1 CHAT domain-containing protein [Okeania sp. SIO2C9]
MLTYPSKQQRKNYQGRSFKNQDLTGQDFSFADIRGTDFTNANLTAANFNYALAGLTKSQTRLIFILIVILFLVAGVAAGGATIVPIRLISSKTTQKFPIQIGVFMFPLLEFINIGLLVIIVRQGIKKIWGYLFTLIILIMLMAVIFASLGLDDKKIVNIFSFLGITNTSPNTVIKLSEWLTDFRFGELIRAFINLLADNGDSENKIVIIIFSFIISAIAILILIFTLSLAVILAGIISGKRLVNSALIWVNIITAFGTGIAARNQVKRSEILIIVMITILAIAISLTLIFIAINLAKKILAEDENNLFILQFAVVIGAIRGTNFENANLTDADFSHATLKSTNFRFANTTRTFWRQTKYLKFARVEKTILEDIKVRELLISGWGKNQEYIEADLRGANLMSADLTNANLKLANLGEASLKAANLNNANLTETLAIGTNFTNAQMSGTCLEGWNIDHTTILDNIESKYIYLLEEPKPETDDRERRPSSGYFQEGDFTKLFQEVLNTVDLIFRNGLNFKAFMSSFQQVQVENQGIPMEIKSMENKGDGVVVVKIDVPPETNKEKIHQEFVQIYDETVIALEEKYQQKLAGIEKQVSLYHRKTEETEYRMFFMNQILKTQTSANAITREKLVILNFEGGSLAKGFTRIKAYIWSDGHPLPMDITSKLPSNLEISQLYQQWSQKYQKLIELYQDLSLTPRIKIKKDQETNVSIKDRQKIISQIQELEKKWRSLLNEWLSFPSFARIENQLRTKIQPSDKVRLIIQSEDNLIQRLPWHLWKFFSDYQLAETAIALPEANRVEKLNIGREKIRILAIFGHDKGLNIQKDKQYLENLPDEAETISLMKPTRQKLDQKLWDEKGWDIICFSGHSQSEKDGSTGYFDLDNQTKIKIEELENALTTAISRGLKLAIFNSCDGLGLARQFAQLHIPAIIVMREPVPDIVAQEFFQNFLQLFSSGKSLYISVRKTREKLQVMEDKFPGASWLPIICQNPAETPPNWRDLHGIYQPNFAEILTDLKLAIETETWLTPADKTETLKQVEILAEVGEIPSQENQYSVKSAIRILRGIVAEHPAANLMDEAVEKLLTYFLNQRNND